VRDHAWRANVESHGVAPKHLDELATGEATPDLIGINHYATSDRFLDHRIGLYPPHLRGGNGALAYSDTEAVRVDLGPGMTGWEPRLREAGERYHLPLIVSEAHLGCDDPDEQVRWLMEAWRAAQSLRAKGADVRAVTAWALFGLVELDAPGTPRPLRTGRVRHA
jgi:dTDP-4-dehydrorhamnose reductase